jgi:hypothetical protein
MSKITYKISSNYQLHSIRWGLLLLGGILLIEPLKHLIISRNLDAYSVSDFADSSVMLITIWLFMAGLPITILHLLYWINNTGVRLEIDDDNITITQKGIIYLYKKGDIVLAEKYLGIYYKNDDTVRIFAPWSDYGYIKIELSDGKLFFFTSLMLNPIMFDSFQCETKYILYPYLNKTTLKGKQEEKEQFENIDALEYKREVLMFLDKFDSDTTEQLLVKIKDSEKYKPSAIDAIKQILSKRNS